MCGQFFAALDVDKKKHTWLKGALSLSFYVTVAPSRCASVSLHLCSIAPLPHCTYLMCREQHVHRQVRATNEGAPHHLLLLAISCLALSLCLSMCQFQGEIAKAKQAMPIYQETRELILQKCRQVSPTRALPQCVVTLHCASHCASISLFLHLTVPLSHCASVLLG